MVDNADGLVADQVGVVPVFLEELAVSLPIDDAAPFLGEVVYFADEVAVEMVEAPVLRPVFLVGMAEMPLANHCRVITGILQSLRERPLVSGKSIGMAGEDDQRLQAVPHGIAAGHQLGTRRGADRHSVKRVQPHAVLGELVDIRSFNVAAPIADVRVAEVVGKNDDNVGFRVCGPREGDRTEQGARSHCDCNRSHAVHGALFPLAMSDVAKSRQKEAGTSRLTFIYGDVECQDPARSVDLAQIPE